MGFNLTYAVDTFLRVLFWKNMENGRFSGRLWPECGNTAWAAVAELGSIGLRTVGVWLGQHTHTGSTHHFK